MGAAGVVLVPGGLRAPRSRGHHEGSTGRFSALYTDIIYGSMVAL